jgi:hypothetical protein
MTQISAFEGNNVVVSATYDAVAECALQAPSFGKNRRLSSFEQARLSAAP